MAKALLATFIALPLFAQTSVEEILERKLLAEIAEYDRKLDGAMGVAIIDLSSGRAIAHNGEAVLAQASLIKVPVLVRAYEAARDGRLKLDERVTLSARDAVGGSGVIRKRLEQGPVTMTVRELLAEMIRSSDNTATNKIISMIGMDSVNAMLDKLGLPKTRLRRIMLDGAAARRGDENVSTPLEMARLVEMIERGNVATPEACKEMAALLAQVEGAFKQGVPDGVEVLSKTGTLPGVQTEAGVVRLARRPFVLSVMMAALPEGRNPVSGIAWMVYKHFARLDGSNAYGHKVH